MRDLFRGTVTRTDILAVIAILGVSFAVYAAFALLVQGKQEERLAAIEDEYQQILGDYEQAKEFDEQIDELRKDTAKTDKLVADFEDRLPGRLEIRGFVRTFEALANEVNLDIELTPGNAYRDPSLPKETYPYEVTVRGDFHQISDFINRLERFKRYLKVSDLRIQEEQDGISKATFLVNTFRFVEEQTAGATG